MTKQKPNSFLHQYDRAFMDSQNVIIIGKKAYRSWRDICLRVQRGEVDTIYNGSPVVIGMHEGSSASGYERIGYEEYNERFQVDRHRYQIDLVRYQIDLEKDIDLKQIDRTLEFYNSPFVVFDIDHSGYVFTSSWMRKTDYAFKLETKANERFLKKSTEIASQIRNVTNIPIIIISYLEDIHHDASDWSDRVVLFQEGRFTNRLDLYLF